MIKRSFIGLTGPRLLYDLVRPDPQEPENIPMPPSLLLLVNEPLDSSKELLIKEGDVVKIGEKLCLYKESTEYVTSPAAGTITSIASIIGDFGAALTQITIKTDQRSETSDAFAALADAPDIDTVDKLLRFIPGAPPLKTLADQDKEINTIIINGADDDLMSTTRQYVLATSVDQINQGAKILKQITGISNISIAVPEEMQNVSAFEGVQSLRVPSTYPSALPEMILKNNLNTTVPPGFTPEDLGICFISVEAVAALAASFQAQKPASEKILSVIGKDGTSRRVKATLGTPLQSVLSEFDLSADDQDRVIVGGPMRGFATYTLDYPVGPETDTIILQDKEDIPFVSDTPCVNCGRCIRICPANIPVNLLVRFLEANLYQEAADSYDLNSCIDCGLCGYVCMAKIPLFQYIKLGKYELLKLESQIETEADNV